MSANDEWAYASVAELRAALSARKVSATELLRAALQRIDRLDGRINAVVVRDDDRALAAAALADAAIAQGETAPLLGVPMTVKESFGVAGLPTTSGDPALARTLAKEDALAVRALKRAGAIILGKTNVPLGLGDIQSHNALYGVTNNPWDVTRTPGGSSGGSAAAVAAGYVPLELGSDIGGSIRIPAHFCGVYGHKPSYGIVSMRGNGTPTGRFSERDLSVAGPLARSARDLETAMDVLVNSDPLQAKGLLVQLPPARQQRLRDFRVLVLDTHPLLAPSVSAQHALAGTVETLRLAGASVSHNDTRVPDLQASHKIYQRLLIGAGLGNRAPAYFEQARKDIAELAVDDDSFQAVRVRAGLQSHRDWLEANEARYALRHQWEALFEDYDVVLTPVSVSPAFAHDHSQPRDARHVQTQDGLVPYLNLFVWVGVATLPGLPATSIPAGLDAQGMPVGIQAIGAYLEDRTPLAFARLLQEASDGFPRPPGF